jgi:multidrug efflux pump subunit AcrA (membrane-fusion protein)
MSKRSVLAKSLLVLSLTGGAGVYLSISQSAESLHPAAPAPTSTVAVRAEAPVSTIVCSGRVEPVLGEVDVAPQVAGQLAEVRVKEGDVVEQGQVVAVVDGPRQAAELAVAEAEVALARSRLAQTEAGNGDEEIQQARYEAESVEASLAYEVRSLERMERLRQRNALALDDLDRQRQRVEQLRRQRDGLRKRHQALRRGALPEEIAVKRTELALAEERLSRAKVERELLMVHAPMSGTILEVFHHKGDTVSAVTGPPVPVIRMADTRQLRIRLEVDEASVTRLRPGLGGTFQIRGSSAEVGRLSLTTIIPSFGPKRLFNPDTSARYDTRILTVLCQPADNRIPLYAGQRVMATLTADSATEIASTSATASTSAADQPPVRPIPPAARTWVKPTPVSWQPSPGPA